jgi:hypothetical protein
MPARDSVQRLWVSAARPGCRTRAPRCKPSGPGPNSFPRQQTLGWRVPNSSRCLSDPHPPRMRIEQSRSGLNPVGHRGARTSLYHSGPGHPSRGSASRRRKLPTLVRSSTDAPSTPLWPSASKHRQSQRCGDNGHAGRKTDSRDGRLGSPSPPSRVPGLDCTRRLPCSRAIQRFGNLLPTTVAAPCAQRTATWFSAAAAFPG